MHKRYFFSLEKLQKYTYLLLLFFLPTQLGKHFWPSFSFIEGLRVDYLSPTLYVSDVFILILLFLSILKFKIPKFKIERKNIFFLLLFSVVVLLGTLFSKSPLASLFGILKLLEMMFFGLITYHFFKNEKNHRLAVYPIALSILFESFLAIAQFFQRSSLGGIMYFFGERSFTMLTPGIANASLQGSLLLRPYGTLPHPNVLAAFLLIGMLFLIGSWTVVSKTVRVGIFLALAAAAFALFLSLSRITIGLFLLLLLIGGGWLFKKHVSKTYLLASIGALVLLGLGIFLTPVGARFASSSFLEESVVVREDLTIQAIEMIRTHLLFGVGLMNFLQNLSLSFSSFSYYTQLQPVHNIYLLVFAQTGILGGILFIYMLYHVFLSVWRAASSLWQKAVCGMLTSVLVLGLFDHYFFTLQQGQLLFAFVIGLCLSLPGKTLPRQKFPQLGINKKMRYNKAA